MSFFKQMTFAQGMIIACLLASAGMSPFVYKNYNQIQDLRLAVGEGGELASLAGRIQSNSLLYTQLYQQKSGASLQGQGRTSEYILKVANDDSVDLGRIDMPKPQVSEGSGGVVDETFTINPSDKNHPFDRVRIGNFLFSLEDRTRRLRVTKLTIDALNEAGKSRVAPEEFPSDKWTFSCKVTSRSRRATN